MIVALRRPEAARYLRPPFPGDAGPRTITENQEGRKEAAVVSNDSKWWSSSGPANAGFVRGARCRSDVRLMRAPGLRCDDLLQPDRLDKTRNFREKGPPCDSVGAAQVPQ